MTKAIFTLIILLGCLLQQVYGQDLIVTSDRQELQVKILEKTDHLVKYKMWDYSNSPLITTSASNIRKIEYQNGTSDLMGNENPRKSKPFGVSAGVALMESDGGMFTTTVDYFIFPQIDLELNLGSDAWYGTYISVGSRFHLNSNHSRRAFTPFVGILYGSEYGNQFIQIPVGLSYITKFGLQASFSVNQMQYTEYNWQSFFSELRLGWRFGK